MTPTQEDKLIGWIYMAMTHDISCIEKRIVKVLITDEIKKEILEDINTIVSFLGIEIGDIDDLRCVFDIGVYDSRCGNLCIHIEQDDDMGAEEEILVYDIKYVVDTDCFVIV